MKTDSSCLIEQMLQGGYEKFNKEILPNKSYRKKTGVDMGGGIETTADRLLAQFLVKVALCFGFEGAIITEAEKGVPQGNTQNGVLAIDELDGTQNFHRGCKRSAVAIALFYGIEKLEDLTFNSIKEGGIVHLYDGDIWVTRDNAVKCNKIVETVSTSKTKKLDSDTTIFFDFNMSCDRLLASKLFPNGIFHCMNTSSAALDLMEISQGTADAYISLMRKSDELAPAYLLIKNAGGVVLDPRTGNDIGNLPYVFGESYQVVAAATQELGEELVARIQKIQGW